MSNRRVLNSNNEVFLIRFGIRRSFNPIRRAEA